MTPGDILGHEPMGVVEAVGPSVTNIALGDRVVVPFNISCGHCFMCAQGLQSQCETTQVRGTGCGAALFGYTKLYGQVPGGQAELLRVPHADYGPIKVPHGPSDDRFLFLSDVLPTAWQAVQYAAAPKHGSLAVLGLGPIGDMACRVAQHLGADNVIGIDLVPERLERARSHGVDVIDWASFDRSTELVDAVRSRTDGRYPDAVIDAVGMEARGSPAAKAAHSMTALLPRAVAAKLMRKAGADRLAALRMALDLVRRGGTVSVVGVYGAMTDPMPMMTSSTSRSNCGWVRPTCGAGWMTSSPPRRRRPARCRHLRDASRPVDGSIGCLLDVPNQERRRDQGGVQPVTSAGNAHPRWP